MNESLEEMDKKETLISNSMNKLKNLFQVFSCCEDKSYIKSWHVYDDTKIQA